MKPKDGPWSPSLALLRKNTSNTLILCCHASTILLLYDNRLFHPSHHKKSPNPMPHSQCCNVKNLVISPIQQRLVNIPFHQRKQEKSYYQITPCNVTKFSSPNVSNFSNFNSQTWCYIENSLITMSNMLSTCIPCKS